ncbi:Meiotic Sister-Chromatid recombination aldehyde dehydrogenase [Paramarasmius palmivorus]|uniref:Meiotic Sister-Chromatid recombination aldehyde dehydrogenase n=1 Tax=Paramarasmius palmivorus TaxID=297713 RepID=A0AAW0DG12_9AGAR
MNWFSSLFSSGSSQSSRKGQAISSTHEAFSLPTSSPIFSSHPEPYNPDTPNTATSYTYPPPSPNSYGYMPTSTASGSRSSTLLPMHHDPLHTPLSPGSTYPSLEHTWNRLKLWLSREYPELGDTLNYGILPQDLAQIEMQFGFALPAVIRESYLQVDGQEAESSAGCSEGLFFGLTLLPLEEVLDEWRFWREVDEDPMTGANTQLRQSMQSIPPGWIRREYSQRGWIPLIADKAGNYVGVDLNPGESGAAGQVIVFGRDFDTKVVLYHGDGPTGWAKWLASFVDDLENGEGYELGGSNDSGDDSEDELGYESYFYDGTGRGQGDGGGDATAGLRLSGEYKGWSVMEAWADRSVRKWYESGVISEKVEEPKDKGIASINPEANQAATEVAIPVLADVSEGEKSSAPSEPAPRRPPPNLPTISVTKPPVPLPVELPTPREVGGLPSPPDSTHSSFDEDIEAARARNTREQGSHRSSQSASGPQAPTPQRRETSPDLLAESEAINETTPIIQPSSELPPNTEVPFVTEPEPIHNETSSPASEEKEPDLMDPDVTIRLVGGGGSSGLVNQTAEEEEENVLEELKESKEPDADADSIHSVTSEGSVANGEKKHKKTKSGLAKKLGKLGIHKKDSVSSVKDVVAPALGLWAQDHEEEGIDVFGLLVAFVTVGIWLVIQREKRSKNSPIAFPTRAPVAADPKWTSYKIPNPHLEAHLTDPNITPMIPTEGKRFITSYDPSNGSHISTTMVDNRHDITEKIRKAVEAQKKWRKTSFTQRRRVIRSLKTWLIDNQELCARVACRDTGKTLIDAALGEIITTASKLEWILDHGERYLRPEKRSRNLILGYKDSYVHYDPLGVVAAIVSWNYPLHNAWSPIVAAIFAGNGIVLKCSENVIWSSSWFVDVIRECLVACGHDPELVQLVCCWPEDADALTKSPLIKHITFIGSETVGRKIAIAATENLTPVTLELGGKDPAVIMPDTNLDQWISLWMRGIFQNAGQNCIGIERLIVHADQYDELYKMLRERIDKLRCGSVMSPSAEGYLTPVDVGSMINDDRFDGLEAWIREAEDDGAQVHGGGKYNHVYCEHGTYFKPALTLTASAAFAPIALVIPYETVDEAIEIANGTKYGLGASVFGPDQELCLQVAKKLECGMVSVNDFAVFYPQLNQDLPFGGTKASGYGRFGGPEGLRGLTNPKVIVVDRWPNFVQTSIPKVLDYPIRSLSISLEFTTGLTRFLYAEGWRPRIGGLIRLIRAARK